MKKETKRQIIKLIKEYKSTEEIVKELNVNAEQVGECMAEQCLKTLNKTKLTKEQERILDKELERILKSENKKIRYKKSLAELEEKKLVNQGLRVASLNGKK